MTLCEAHRHFAVAGMFGCMLYATAVSPAAHLAGAFTSAGIFTSVGLHQHHEQHADSQHKADKHHGAVKPNARVFVLDARGAGHLTTTDDHRAVRHATCQPDAGFEGLPLTLPAGNASFPALYRYANGA